MEKYEIIIGIGPPKKSFAIARHVMNTGIEKAPQARKNEKFMTYFKNRKKSYIRARKFGKKWISAKGAKNDKFEFSRRQKENGTFYILH